MNEFTRTRMLLGGEAMERLKASTIAVFGIGGVGSFAAEAIVRSGIGGIALFDSDKVDITNINRQLIAAHSTIGKKKAQVMKERVTDINPECNVQSYECFYTAENAPEYDLSKYDYIVDAIDTVSSKLTLIEQAKKAGVPIISSMGAGNKLDPTKFEVADIYETSVCPLAKVMRRELKVRGIDSLKVVYSKEEVLKPFKEEGDTGAKADDPAAKRQAPGSAAFVPSVAGLIIAAEVIKDLAGR